MNKLTRIEPKYWREIRDLFKVEWPKHAFSYAVVDTFIDWDRDYNGNSLAKIYSFDENWRNHGTFFLLVSWNRFKLIFSAQISKLQSVNYAYCDSLDNSSKNEVKLLKLIDFQELKKTDPFDCVMTNATDLSDHLDQLKMASSPAPEYFTQNENIIVKDLECPPDMESRRLTLKDVDKVNRYWAHGTELSLVMNKVLVERFPSVGLFKKSSGELIGWALM